VGRFRPGVATAREELELKDEGQPEAKPIMNALVSLVLTNLVHRLPLRLGASVFGVGSGRTCFPAVPSSSQPTVSIVKKHEVWPLGRG
jgi:hypothetical protein